VKKVVFEQTPIISNVKSKLRGVPRYNSLLGYNGFAVRSGVASIVIL
jgi:hypothetical protein